MAGAVRTMSSQFFWPYEPQPPRIFALDTYFFAWRVLLSRGDAHGTQSVSKNENMTRQTFHRGRRRTPKCVYNRKEIECLTFASPSGGITGEILVKVLSYLDEAGILPSAQGGPTPCLIVDGHQSRLDPCFVEYINSEGHKWKVYIGVPYGTSLWQVGDAAELNGNLKNFSTKKNAS